MIPDFRHRYHPQTEGVGNVNRPLRLVAVGMRMMVMQETMLMVVMMMMMMTMMTMMMMMMMKDNGGMTTTTSKYDNKTKWISINK